MTARPLNQKLIGVLGGSSNVATGEYYKFLNAEVNARLGGWEIAETLIAGMNFGNIEAFIRGNDWNGLEMYIEKKARALVQGGAELLISVSNTLHKPLEPIAASLGIPLIHIVDPTGEAIKEARISRVALFGTRPVMEMEYIKERYKERFGLEILVPTADEQEDIDTIIFDELVKNEIKPESKARYLDIAQRMEKEAGAQGLIMGCTEIFLLIEQQDRPDFPMFNTTELHCKAAVDFALGATP